MSDQLDTAAIRETQPSPEPVAWQYRYADPLTGKPIWRMRSDTWNGQRAKEGRPLYTTPQPDELARLQAENEQLRGFMEDFAACKFERIERRAPDPQDDLGPLTDYLAVEAWQDDARAALAAMEADHD